MVRGKLTTRNSNRTAERVLEAYTYEEQISEEHDFYIPLNTMLFLIQKNRQNCKISLNTDFKALMKSFSKIEKQKVLRINFSSYQGRVDGLKIIR